MIYFQYESDTANKHSHDKEAKALKGKYMLNKSLGLLKIVSLPIEVKLESGETLTYMSGFPVYYSVTSENDIEYTCEYRMTITPCKVSYENSGYIRTWPYAFSSAIRFLSNSRIWDYEGKMHYGY